jgi:hypothetical protein
MARINTYNGINYCIIFNYEKKHDKRDFNPLF